MEPVREKAGEVRGVVRAAWGADLADRDLVARALDGDRWAEEALFRRHVADVLNTVARLLGSADDAEDVVQETFALALSRLGTLREPDALRGWLLQIAVRKVHRIFRRERIRRALGLDRTADAESGLARLAAGDASPELRAELALIDAVLRDVGPAERLAWMLRHVEGYVLPEVAAACGCSLATVKRRIAAADARIRSRLDRRDDAED